MVEQFESAEVDGEWGRQRLSSSAFAHTLTLTLETVQLLMAKRKH